MNINFKCRPVVLPVCLRIVFSFVGGDYCALFWSHANSVHGALYCALCWWSLHQFKRWKRHIFGKKKKICDSWSHRFILGL